MYKYIGACIFAAESWVLLIILLSLPHTAYVSSKDGFYGFSSAPKSSSIHHLHTEEGCFYTYLYFV